MHDEIAILDFGSQYTQLIARRIRELGVYTKIVPPETPVEKLCHVKGVILSGGPQSVFDQPIPCDQKIFTAQVPILGICFGMQLMNMCHQGSVVSKPKGEYGKQTISLKYPSPLFLNLEKQQLVWMSHGDSIHELSPSFKMVALSSDNMIAAIEHKTLPLYGVQFHPEVTHTKQGKEILSNFLDQCQCQRSWTMENYLDDAVYEIRQRVGSEKVVSLVSGGVDSTAATMLLSRALDPSQIIPLHIDNGLMRKGESEKVCAFLKELGLKNLKFVNAKKEFLSSLEAITNPEEKRKRIGTLFIEILEKEMKMLGYAKFLCQGTLYTDLIESGKGCGNQAHVIKSHHNVNPPIVEKKRKEGLIIEPNSMIFKDEVRRLSKMLNIPHALIGRHPFPGPGLAIRIIGNVTKERVQCLQEADAIYLEEIQKAKLYDDIWQAFAVLIPVSTVGVMGDKRTEGSVIALRAVTSIDGMTADFYPMPYDLLGKITTRIINEVPGITRVVYDTTSKPPGTIEWE